MTHPMATDSEPSAQTLSHLEARLRHLEWLITGNSSLTSQETTQDGAESKGTVTTQISSLEYDLQKLAAKNALVSQVLHLHSQYPSLFHPIPPTEVPATLTDENLASIILSCAASFPETASRLTSLKDLPIPPASASEELIKLQPRLDEALEKQITQANEVRDLRERSAQALKRWYEIGIVGQGEVWTEWSERVEKIERDIRRTEKALEVDYT